MTKLLFAFQFLTIFPLKTAKSPDRETISGSAIFFPVVGLILGLILAGLNTILTRFNFDPLLISALVIVFLIFMTGGLHLDGLADSFDALGSFQEKESALKIMRDSHIGTMGVLSLINVILLKIVILSSLEPFTINASIILMSIAGRYCMTFAIKFFPYAREEGKGKDFFAGMNFKKFISATLIALLFSFFIFKIAGTMILLVSAFFTFLFCRWITKKLGGITGDTLGAVNELVELFVLLNYCLADKILWRIL